MDRRRPRRDQHGGRAQAHARRRAGAGGGARQARGAAQGPARRDGRGGGEAARAAVRGGRAGAAGRSADHHVRRRGHGRDAQPAHGHVRHRARRGRRRAGARLGAGSDDRDQALGRRDGPAGAGRRAGEPPRHQAVGDRGHRGAGAGRGVAAVRQRRDVPELPGGPVADRGGVHGGDYGRLREVKRAYDPDGFFRVGHVAK
ncbi:BBE domain-containing protein [Nonomuraea thailandensis]